MEPVGGAIAQDFDVIGTSLRFKRLLHLFC